MAFSPSLLKQGTSVSSPVKQREKGTLYRAPRRMKGIMGMNVLITMVITYKAKLPLSIID